MVPFGVILTQLPDHPSAPLRMWWSLPNWCRLLPVLGGTLLAPMALVSVSTPPMSNLTPDIAFTPMSPVGPESPVGTANPTTPVAPAHPVTLAGQGAPITPSATTSAVPASHASAEPGPSAAAATGSPVPAGTVATGSTTTTSPVPVAAPTASPQPLPNDTSTTSIQSGLPVLDSRKDSVLLADELVRSAAINEASFGGRNG